MKKLLVFLLISSGLFALEKNDFAYGKHINIEKNSGLIRVQLNSDVYTSLVHSDLSDIAVFDSVGHIMPREISTSSTTTVEAIKQEVPFVKFDVLKRSTDQQMKFEYKGALIQMLSEKQTKNEDYIVDLHNIKRAVKNLYIYSDEKNYMISMDVECSRDLQVWKNIKNGAVLADLNFQNSLVSKNRIELSSYNCKYLRIKTEKKFSITKIEVQEYPLNVSARLEIEKINYKENRNGLEFKLSNNIRVENIYFNIEKKEQLYKLNILAKNSKENEWKRIESADIYTIVSDNKRLEKYSINMNSKYNYYRIEAQNSSYLPSNISLSYQYKRQDLYFMAQGEAPYLLAFGSFDSRVSSVNLYQSYKSSIYESSLSDTIDLGGKSKLYAKEKKTSTRTYLVWFALIFGVFLLAYISSKLYKQLKDEEK